MQHNHAHVWHIISPECQNLCQQLLSGFISIHSMHKLTNSITLLYDMYVGTILFLQVVPAVTYFFRTQVWYNVLGVGGHLTLVTVGI